MATAVHICPDSDGECEPRSLDRVIAALASGQHGVVSRSQLLAAGLGRGAIDRRVGTGRLHPIHRGVFAVGHRVPTKHGRWMAAVLAGGDGAALSYRSAAELWRMRDTARSRIEVTVPRNRRGRPGVEYHRIALAPDEVTVEEGIPVTNPHALLDLAAVLTRQQLEHALNEAEIRRLASPLPLDALVGHPNRREIETLKRALDKHRRIGETVIRSDFETAFLDFTDRFGLPRPIMNAPLGPYEPDAQWPEQRVVVELDSYGIHTTRQAFEADRERDRRLQAAGYRVARITWRQLHTEPDEIAAELRAVLATADPRPR
jgi:hypothetical protein